jgi:hypothetical protein
MYRFGKTADAILEIVIVTAFSVTFLSKIIWDVLHGSGFFIAAIAALVIGFGVPALWDRRRCARWPQPTELSAPHVVTEQVESVDRTREG